MFAIIISEKGGAERRDSFDKSEINIGRVQGNDLMLPKGNVSKHHARLLSRDGRFIVTDLKSTNGTYVNGRKIAQATIVREGDKIYIGDFVLRLEVAAQVPVLATTADGQEDDSRTGGRENVVAPRIHNPVAVTMKAPTHPPGAPLPRPQPSNVSNAPPPGAPVNRPSDPNPREESAPLQKPRTSPALPVQTAGAVAGGPPRIMTAPLNQAAAVGPRAPLPLPGNVVPTAVPPPLAAAPPPQAAPPPAPPAAAVPAPAPAQPSVSQQPPPRDRPSQQRLSHPPGRVVPKESPAQAGRRLALTMLMGRIAEAVDLSPLRASPTVPAPLAQQIERTAREQAIAMRDEGEAPQDIDLEILARDAHRELVGLGAIGPLLEDEEVSEIHCIRYDQLCTVRSGKTVTEAAGFSSEEALYRVIARLAQQSGDPWRAGETLIERRLARASFVAIAPAVAASHVVSIRKRRRLESTLDDLVRQSSLSRPMAQFLEACVMVRCNILVCGAATGAVLSALASTGSAGERACVVHEIEEIGVGSAHAIPVSIVDTRKTGEESVRAASRLRPDRLVVAQLAGGVAAATVDAMVECNQCVFAAISAPTLRQALTRLVAQLVLHRPGLGLDATRDVVGEAFDIAVEVATLPDGRPRVTRISELGGSDAKGIVARDVFVFSADPTDARGGEGAFSATGVAPRIANDLALRGMKLDPAMFKRAGR